MIEQSGNETIYYKKVFEVQGRGPRRLDSVVAGVIDLVDTVRHPRTYAFTRVTSQRKVELYREIKQ